MTGTFSGIFERLVETTEEEAARLSAFAENSNYGRLAKLPVLNEHPIPGQIVRLALAEPSVVALIEERRPAVMNGSDKEEVEKRVSAGLRKRYLHNESYALVVVASENDSYPIGSKIVASASEVRRSRVLTADALLSL